MTRTMVDAYLASNWPATGWQLGAAYINGTRTASNYKTARLLYPDAQILTVTVDGTLTDADACDCETGDYTPASAAAWANWRHTRGFRPCIYSARATWPLIVEELYKLGLMLSEVDWWASTLDGTLGPYVECPDGLIYNAVAVQYTQGGHGRYDLSLVYDDTWHALTPPPSPLSVLVAPARKRKQMLVIVSDGTEQWLCFIPETGPLSAGWKHHLPNPAVGAAWAKQLAVTDVPTDPDFANGITTIV